MSKHTVAILLIAILSWGTEASTGARHAVLIGISDYRQSGLHDLPGTQNDIELVEQVLKDRLGFGDETNNIHILRNEQATHTEIQMVFEVLEDKLQPDDFVYIHYSGHGSETWDGNGDEQGNNCSAELKEGKPFCMDQTWVAFGSRTSTSKGLDRWDILDDEINRWVTNLYRRTHHIVMVVDSCHSGTSMRGEGPAIRAARAASPDDQDNHPEARKNYHPEKLEQMVSIAAVRDDESALEKQVDGKPYGMFTWNWVQSLRRAAGNETWEQIFQRTTALIGLSRGGVQHPQLSGLGRSDPVFPNGESLDENSTLITDVGPDNKVRLGIGKIQGATVGSRYVRVGSPSAQVQVTKTEITYSQADVLEGSLQKGDFVREIDHSYPAQPVNVWVASDSGVDDDRVQAEQIRQLFVPPPKGPTPLAGFALVNTQGEEDIQIRLVRPKTDPAGRLIYVPGTNGRDALPVNDDQSALEAWVLTPDQRLLHQNMRIALSDLQRGIRRLLDNLRKYRKLRAVQVLALEGSGMGLNASGIKVDVLTYEPCPAEGPCGEAFDAGNEGRFRPTGAVNLENYGKIPRLQNELVSFRIENHGKQDVYVYIFNLTSSGEIIPLFPLAGQSPDQAALIKQDQPPISLANSEYDCFVKLDKPGEESFWVIVTAQSIDHRVLAQEGFRGAARKGELNPLEQLLVGEVRGTRGTSLSMRSGTWTSQLTQFRIETASSP